ncbi:hypothetical protein ABT373_29620 [Streptomyces sp. NPDC000070]|uniref:hypothetical protein n=1 Tax=Streptomyces sp. NPDC000070 TaxID=3154240 RepID=UPI0033204D8F
MSDNFRTTDGLFRPWISAVELPDNSGLSAPERGGGRVPRPRSEISEGVSGEMRAFAEFLRDLVDECGVTQQNLALKIGFPPQRLSETLRGELLPLLDVVERIVNATVPVPRRPMMLKRAERLHGNAAAAPRAPALVRSERQVESLLAQKESLFNDLDALRKDGALLVMFLLRMIARLDRQMRDLTSERDALQRDHAPYTTKLDELGRELWRTKQQRERASQKLETAQEQRADAEQRYIAAQLEIEELQEELAKLRAGHEASAPGPAHETEFSGNPESVAGLSDDIDDALSKIDVVLHTQAETIQRLSEHGDDASSGYPADNRTTSEDGPGDDEPVDSEEPADTPAYDTDAPAASPAHQPTTAAEAAGFGPLHVLRLADSLWHRGEHEELVAQLERAVSLQTPEEIETTSVLLRGLRDGPDIRSLLSSVLSRRGKRPPSPPPPSPWPSAAQPSPSAGFLSLTVAPDACGTVRACPLEDAPDTPRRHSPTARSQHDRQHADALLPPGYPLATPPVLERQYEREYLVRILARGRSVRLTGARGSGRTTLLGLVAEDCVGVAPDDVVRLDGHGKGPAELLYELCGAVFDLRGHRIGQTRLHRLVQQIGAIVVIDDLGFGGDELDEFLRAAPECAFLFSATPGTPVPSDDSYVEEVHLGPLSRQACGDLLRWSVGRELTENENFWAGDVWFIADGLALSLVQAGSLLRHRENQSLPPAAQGAAAASALASRLSEEAREVLRLAVALGGEVPHRWHLPALLGRSDADASVAELVQCGLVTVVGARYRLADRVAPQLDADGYAEGAIDRLCSIGGHYAWYAGNAGVTPRQITLEAPAILSTLAGLTTSDAHSCTSTAVRLARSVSVKFAAGGAWEAWRRALRYGRHAAQQQHDAVADRAYFHHELGLLFLCRGEREPARAALEAAVTLHASLSDSEGAERGRRALALLAARQAAAEPVATTLRLLAPSPA